MAINLSLLGVVAGAAQGYSDRVDSLRDELKDNKRKQREWLATYGNKALDESNKKQETITSALDDLKARGLKVPDAIQLLQKHGAGAVLELQRYVKNYEDTNNTKVDEVLMNKLWTAAEDFTTEDRTFEDAVNTLFGSPKDGATAPVIQEVEDRNFFERIKYNMGDRYEDEYEDFLSDPIEGIGGKSIKELKALSVVSPSMLGTEGSAVFDRSVLRGSESTTSERAQWKVLKGTILSNALNSLDPTVANKIRVMQGEISDTSRSDDDQWNMLTATNAPEAYKEAISEATRNAAEDIDLGGNRAAWNSYGGQNALDAILNPPPPPEPLTPKQLADQLDQDLIDNSLTEARPEDIGEKTDVEIGMWFQQNNKDFVIANGELRNRDPAAPFDKSKVVTPLEAEVTEAQEAQTERLKTAENILPSERPELSGRSGTAEYGESLRKRASFDAANEGKYELDGTPILAPMYPNSETEAKLLVEPPWNFNVKGADKKEDAKEPSAGDSIRKPSDLIAELEDKTLENFQEEWNARYKETHDPLTGFPLGAKFTESAEADE